MRCPTLLTLDGTSVDNQPLPVDHCGMTRTKQVVTALGLLLFADGLLLLTSSFTTLAKAVQLPLWGGFLYAMYLDNPESFHKPVSTPVIVMRLPSFNTSPTVQPCHLLARNLTEVGTYARLQMT